MREMVPGAKSTSYGPEELRIWIVGIVEDENVTQVRAEFGGELDAAKAKIRERKRDCKIAIQRPLESAFLLILRGVTSISNWYALSIRNAVVHDG
jgi:hypothetical protein